MKTLLRSLGLFALILTLLMPVGVQAAVPNPPTPNAPTPLAAAAWYDGGIVYSTVTNCISIIQGFPYQENGAGTFVGFLADPDSGLPAPNTVYYVHIYIAGMGNACSGMRAYVDIALPSFTSLAIDNTNRLYCLFDGVQIPANECPQSLSASGYNLGAYRIPSIDAANAYTWPLPQGHTIEFQIPVRSTAAFNNIPLTAHIWMLDGNSSPWLRPQQGVYVFSSQPTILYPSPSTSSITATSGYSEAYLYAFGATGTGHFELGTAPNAWTVSDPVNITTPGQAWRVWDQWGPPALLPDTLYYWRFTFTTPTQTYIGNTQTFRTLPDGRVTIGQGASAACTGAALDSALATAKEIVFDCGALPLSITMTGAKNITSAVTIDGGNKITLSTGGTGNHFNVLSGGNLTLKKITLSGGNNTGACGGAVSVLSGGTLTLNETRLINNYSDWEGGALCNWGNTTVMNTLFTTNTSASHGGAIGNYASLYISNSKFTSNTAVGNGGAIDMGGSVSVFDSTFTSNSGLRGGGINTYGGSLTVSNSNFISNSAAAWGGGLANDASNTSVTNATFYDNSTTGVGGGIETSGAGSLTLTNTTISGNRAASTTPGAITQGGGLFWFPGVGTGPVTMLNVTIANNTAGTQGGNIYNGSTGVYNGSINLKNTLVAGGAPNNCSGTVLSNGYNLENTNTCGFGSAGDKVNVNPQLGPLQNNGGTMQTRALLFGSPAIDAGNTCPATDQRGVVRPQDGNRDGSSVCDIGAYEAPPLWGLFLPFAKK